MQSDHEARLEVATAGDEWDAVAAVARLVGRKWHAVVLHRLLARGPSGFDELARSIEGISHKVLSDCLDHLEAKGLVTRRGRRERSAVVRQPIPTAPVCRGLPHNSTAFAPPAASLPFRYPDSATGQP